MNRKLVIVFQHPVYFADVVERRGNAQIHRENTTKTGIKIFIRIVNTLLNNKIISIGDEKVVD